MTRRRFENAVLIELDHLYHVALCLTGSPHEAEDVVQETCLQALRFRKQLCDEEKVRPWLFKILKNTFLNHAKKERRRLELLESASFDALDKLAEKVRDNALPARLSAVLEKALTELVPEFRLAVVLNDIEELSYREIAAVMECPVGTVRSRVARGRAELARKIQKALPDERSFALETKT